VDIRIPGSWGLELQAKLNEADQRIPIMFITAQGDDKLRLQAPPSNIAGSTRDQPHNDLWDLSDVS
jgi:CheY-like chemotaxis protein